MNVIFFAHREWAINVYKRVRNNPKLINITLCSTHTDFASLEIDSYDLIFACGNSESLEFATKYKIPIVGVHCAGLDRYSYGSPIQNQIIDGVIFTKHRLVKFVYDSVNERRHASSREYAYEVDLDLSGSIEDVFYQLTATSVVLFNFLLIHYPNLTWQSWPLETIQRVRRSPVDSELNVESLTKMSCLDLYNFIRCLGGPYPRAYIKDETGTIYFEAVTFKENK